MIKTVCKSYRGYERGVLSQNQACYGNLSMAMRKKVFRAPLGVCTKFELSSST